MLSRVAENIYWMARCIERSENTARLIMVNTNLLLDLPKGLQPGWQPIVEILGSHEDFLEQNEDFNERSVLKIFNCRSKVCYFDFKFAAPGA